MKKKPPLDPNAIHTIEEVEEALEMSTEELLKSGKFVRLYDWMPSLKLYDLSSEESNDE